MTAHPSPTPVSQPHPIKGRESIVPLVQADLESRMRAGIKTYGRPLESHNGRDSLRDLYEELLDGACYVKQAMLEIAELKVELAELRETKRVAAYGLKPLTSRDDQRIPPGMTMYIAREDSLTPPLKSLEDGRMNG